MPKRPASVSPPLKIYEIKLDRGALDAMPIDARRTLFLFGHVANELNTLHRLLIFSIKEQENSILTAFSEARAATIARLLIGTTHEGYLAVQRSVLGQTFGQTYVPHLSRDGQDALGRVRKNLGDMKLMAAIRNNFAFHLPYPSQIDDAYTRLPADLDLSIYSGEQRHSSMNVMSNLMMTRAMLDTVDGANGRTDQENMSFIISDVLKKSIELNDFIEHLLIVIVEREKLSPDVMKEVLTVDGHQSVKTFTIPPVLRG